MASFRNTEAKGAYSGGSDSFSLAFLVAMASSVAVVRQVITGELLGRKREPHQMIRWMAWLSRAQRIY